MSENLRLIYDSVNDWLKFAEAKNGAIVALNSAILTFVVSFDHQSRDWLVSFYVVSLGSACVISLALALLSFLPILSRNFRFLDLATSSNAENVLYFGSIASCTLEEFRSSCHQQIPDCSKDVFFDQLTDQIHINSKIAVRKYKLFSGALLVLMVGLFTPLVGLPLLASIKLTSPS